MWVHACMPSHTIIYIYSYTNTHRATQLILPDFSIGFLVPQSSHLLDRCFVSTLLLLRGHTGSLFYQRGAAAVLVNVINVLAVFQQDFDVSG